MNRKVTEGKQPFSKEVRSGENITENGQTDKP